MTAPIDLESLRRITAAFDLAINRCDLWPSERTQIREAARYWKAALDELTTRRARDAEVAALVAEHTKWAESFGAACVCALQGDFHPIENLARCMPIHFPDGAPMLRSDPLAPFTGSKP
jgi:hypothetical protein